MGPGIKIQILQFFWFWKFSFIKNSDYSTLLLRMHSVSVQSNKRCCQLPLLSENKEMKTYSQGNWSLKAWANEATGSQKFKKYILPLMSGTCIY